MPESIEKVIGDLSSYISSALNSLGLQRYGLERDDLLQEIRIRIWQAYTSKHNEIQYFNAYVRKIVYSVFINEINRKKKENKILESAESHLSQNEELCRDSTPEDEVLKQVLLASINQLKESKRLVIKLRLEGFSIGEIAKLNSWTYRKTCLMSYRAIEELRRIMAKRGIHYEG